MQLYKILFLSALCFANQSFADDNVKNMEISIYNNNLALVKDTRDVKLLSGKNNVAFEGVASQIKAESVMIIGKDINVLEQNYDYDLITPQNILEKSIGNKVKTVVQNPKTGENIFDQATILSAVGTTPVLEFDYGIETDFNGRLVFEQLPKNLQQKPTLMAKIYSPQAGIKELELVYLTNGISWKTNYVARIVNDKHLDLTAWVAINNMSGVDYNNALIQLVAGDVNQVKETGLTTNRVMMAKAVALETADASFAMGDSRSEQLSSYQLYTLPNRADIKDNQTKQVSLFERNNITYRKEGRLNSMLYFNGGYKAEFEKNHPLVYYIINNTKADGLYLPLPAGIVRFYENDSNENMQFIGENNINHTAKGEKIELKLGKMFNVFVNGKITDVKEISKNKIQSLNNGCFNADIIKDYVAEIEFNNGGDDDAHIVFTQNIGQDVEIIKENIKGKNKNINQYEWEIPVLKNAKTDLKYTVRVKSKERICN